MPLTYHIERMQQKSILDLNVTQVSLHRRDISQGRHYQKQDADNLCNNKVALISLKRITEWDDALGSH